MQFALSSDMINKYIGDENTINIFFELIRSCLNSLLFQSESIFATAGIILLDFMNYTTSDSDSKAYSNLSPMKTVYRRNCIYDKNNTTRLNTTASSFLLNNKSQSQQKANFDMSNMKALKEKMQLLKGYHKRALGINYRSVSNLSKQALSERRLKIIKSIS